MCLLKTSKYRTQKSLKTIAYKSGFQRPRKATEIYSQGGSSPYQDHGPFLEIVVTFVFFSQSRNFARFR